MRDESGLLEGLDILMARLRRERKRRGLSQETVARRMGVSQARVSEIETGDVEKMAVGTLVPYFNALGVRVQLTVDLPATRP
jgi:transcriptional regulator with XRE-family HTH domain